MTRPLAELLSSVKQVVRVGANICVWVVRNSKGHLLILAQGSPYEGLGFLIDGQWCIQLALGLFKVSRAPP